MFMKAIPKECVKELTVLVYSEAVQLELDDQVQK